MTIKLAERALATPHLWIYFDVFSIVALDLLRKPQVAKDYALDVQCILVPYPHSTLEKTLGTEVMFQIRHIKLFTLSSIPGGTELFERQEGDPVQDGMLLHNILVQDGNPFLLGHTRSMQISQALQSTLLGNLAIAIKEGSGMVRLPRFGIGQYIPLNTSAIAQ